MVNDLQEYQKAALVTAAPLEPKQQLVHCTMGVAGEAGELHELILAGTPSGRIGEIGDCLWYVAVASDLLGARLCDVAALCQSTPLINSSPMASLEVYSARLADQVKKYVFYSKPIHEVEILQNLSLIVQCLDALAQLHGASLLEVAEVNRRKLEARYKGGGFSAALAINRDYGAESAAAGTEIV